MTLAGNPPPDHATAIAQRRLLVLDDDPAILKTIRMMARKLGLDVLTCTKAAELETALASFAPDFILIDLMMPHLDGIDVVRAIGPRPDCSLFVMSGTDARTFEASREALAACAAPIGGFLNKPFGTAELARVLSASAAGLHPQPACLKEHPHNVLLSPAQFEKVVRSGGIEPFFQPIFHSNGRTLKGFEALARIQGGQTCYFAPEYLGQLVADENLSAIVTDTIIQRSMQFMAELPGKDRLSISINLFGTHAIADGFREKLVAQCMRAGIATDRVILELSEAAVFNLDEEKLRRITQLRLAGFGLSIDDFGTGHSSLGRLASLPFSELKIDKAFCLALPHSQPAAAVIEACLGLAARLNMKVTAEGVEDEEVAALLVSMGCDHLQGHLFGKAMSGDTLLRWLNGSSPRAAA